MRGSPLIRALAIMAILLLGFFPLWKLTHGADAVMPSTAPVSALQMVHVELRFANPVSSFQILHSGKTVWSGENPGESAQTDLQMNFPAEGIDLEIKATAIDPQSSIAVRVTVSAGTGDPFEKTAWGKGTVDEALTFKEPN